MDDFEDFGSDSPAPADDGDFQVETMAFPSEDGLDFTATIDHTIDHSADEFSDGTDVVVDNDVSGEASDGGSLDGVFATPVQEFATPVQEGSPVGNSEEEDAVRAFQQKHESFLAEKAQQSEAAHRAHQQQAVADVESYYEERRAKIAKTAQKNREDEARNAKLLSDAPSSAQESWGRLDQLVDMNESRFEGKDVSRFKSVLLAAKHRQWE
eukprot:TRINITY_DN12745_c1_g1_i1.p1 TRINITY_DN12745_c1_g1~~TRINITY_DN12745_c1_g1_i1.p1  ORF type:complete len:225 (+),score=62.56 TRINITY_DN12745_c1_g1_i1:44-676(+)